MVPTALPDMILSAWWEGRPETFTARDVPAGVFFYGFQDTFPGAPCFQSAPAAEQRKIRAGMTDWSRGLLERVIVDPILEPEMAAALGSAHDELFMGYLWAVGYSEPPRIEREQMVPPQVAEQPGPPLRPSILLRTLTALPQPNLKGALKMIAHRAGVPVHLVWREWPISAFIFNWHVVLTDELTRRTERRSGTFPRSEIMDAVGREAS